MKVSIKNDQIILVNDAGEGSVIMTMLCALGGHALGVEVRSEVNRTGIAGGSNS